MRHRQAQRQHRLAASAAAEERQPAQVARAHQRAAVHRTQVV